VVLTKLQSFSMRAISPALLYKIKSPAAYMFTNTHKHMHTNKHATCACQVYDPERWVENKAPEKGSSHAGSVSIHATSGAAADKLPAHSVDAPSSAKPYATFRGHANVPSGKTALPFRCAQLSKQLNHKPTSNQASLCMMQSRLRTVGCNI
jgi:hypothetical protein